MSTASTPIGLQELQEAVDRLLTGQRDPIASRLARERLDRGREELRKRIGTIEVAVELIREVRDR